MVRMALPSDKGMTNLKKKKNKKLQLILLLMLDQWKILGGDIITTHIFIYTRKEWQRGKSIYQGLGELGKT